MYQIELTSPAKKDIKRLNKTVLKKLDRAIHVLSRNPLQPQTKKMANFPRADYRYRIGNYRILFKIQNNIVYIQRVLPKSKAYKI